MWPALAAGCSDRSPGSLTPVASPTPPGDSGGKEPSATAVPKQASITFTVWLPPEIASLSVPSDGRPELYAKALAEAAPLPEDVRVAVSTKSANGKGNMLESVLATAPVLPARLPHLILLDAAELPALVAGGLAQPIVGLDEAAYWDTLQPFAEQAVTFDGVRYGAPLCADLVLLAYDNTRINTPPSTWQELISGTEALVLPGTGPDAVDTLLTFYLSEGGAVSTSDPVLDTTALAQALGAYQVGRESARVHADSVSLTSFDATWSAYLAGKSHMVVTSSRQVLEYRDDAPTTSITRLPMSGRRSVSLVRVLAWVIITPDTDMQALALAYIAASALPEQQQLLAQRAFHLPAVASELDESIAGPWRASVIRLLATARPVPPCIACSTLEQALEDASFSVLSGTASPIQAASLAAVRSSAQ